MTIRQRLGRLEGSRWPWWATSSTAARRGRTSGGSRSSGARDRVRPVDARLAPLARVGRRILLQAGRRSCRGSTCSTCCGSSSSGRRRGRSPPSASTPICTRWTASGWPRQARHLDPGPGADQPRGRGDSRRCRWPAVGHSGTGHQRRGGADGRVVAGDGCQLVAERRCERL